MFVLLFCADGSGFFLFVDNEAKGEILDVKKESRRLPSSSTSTRRTKSSASRRRTNSSRSSSSSSTFPLLLVYEEGKLLSVKEEDRYRVPSRPDHQD